MSVSRKSRRLLEATQRFHSFNFLIDSVTLLLFFYVAVSTANKVLPKALIDQSLFRPSWSFTGICAVIFLILFMSQTRQEIRARRELTPFEREATIKASRKYNPCWRRSWQ